MSFGQPFCNFPKARLQVNDLFKLADFGHSKFVLAQRSVLIAGYRTLTVTLTVTT